MDGWKSPGGPRYRAPTVLISRVSKDTERRLTSEKCRLLNVGV